MTNTVPQVNSFSTRNKNKELKRKQEIWEVLHMLSNYSYTKNWSIKNIFPRCLSLTCHAHMCSLWHVQQIWCQKFKSKLLFCLVSILNFSKVANSEEISAFVTSSLAKALLNHIKKTGTYALPSLTAFFFLPFYLSQCWVSPQISPYAIRVSIKRRSFHVWDPNYKGKTVVKQSYFIMRILMLVRRYLFIETVPMLQLW